MWDTRRQAGSTPGTGQLTSGSSHSEGSISLHYISFPFSSYKTLQLRSTLPPFINNNINPDQRQPFTFTFTFTFTSTHTPTSSTYPRSSPNSINTSIMARGEAPQVKCHYKGKDEDFIVFVDDVKSANAWKNDKTVPLAQVVSSFKIFVTHKYVPRCVVVDGVTPHLVRLLRGSSP
jgi:hypothetical protein